MEPRIDERGEISDNDDFSSNWLMSIEEVIKNPTPDMMEMQKQKI